MHYQPYFTALPYLILAANVSALYYLLTRKRHFLIDVAAFAATLALAVAGGTIVRSFGMPRVAVTLLMGYLFLIPTLLLFKEDWKVKSFTFFLIFALSQYIVLIFSFIAYYSKLYFIDVVSAESIQLITLGVEVAVFVLGYRGFLNRLRPVLQIIQDGSAVLLLLPIGACNVLATLRVHGEFNVYWLVITLMVTGILLAVVYLIHMIIALLNREHYLENHLTIQLNHYRQMTESIQQSRNHRCNLRHHLAGMIELLQRQEIAATQEYVERLNERYEESYIPSFCGNKYVDAVVAYYYKIARRESIPLTIKLALPEQSGIESLDLCVMIGNCFENAIEACRAMPADAERQISIHAKIAHGYMAITIKNSCAHAIRRCEGGFISTKAADRIGIGLESVRLLTQKYEGDIQISAADGNFIAAISLKLPGLDSAAK